MIGNTISHYRIIEKIAEGGMGVVYKAEDLRLKRIVALKFLHSKDPDEDALRAFVAEAQATALLEHPYICTVFEVDEIGTPPTAFIAMQYLPGGSVKDRLKNGALPVQQALDVVIQSGQGLVCAHSAGMIHRDIKPGNIMFAADDTVKIVDFGLAQRFRHSGDTATARSIQGIAGTLSYMSPEQAQGAPIDHRTDIWSLGVVLYEMLSGKPPFTGDNELAVLYAILHHVPPPLAEARPELPEQLNWIVRKAMARSLTQRYQAVDEFVEDVRELSRNSASAGLIASAPADAVPAIAVLPFSDMSPDRDQGFFCEGIAEEIINAFSQVEGVHVASRGSSFQFSSAYDVRDVGKKLKVDMVLEGSVRRAGNRLRVIAQLINTQNGFHVWSQRFDRTGEDIFDIQDEIAMAVMRELRVKLAGDSGLRRYTENTEAHNLYLRGRYFWNHRLADAVRKAMVEYKKALEIDPNYSLAYSGLADCYLMPAYYGISPPDVVIPLALASAEKALDLDPDLPEAHATMGMIRAIHGYNFAESERHFRIAIERNSRYAVANMWYALFNLVPNAHFEKALIAARRAQEIDPLVPAVNSTLGACLFYAKQYRDAIRVFEGALEVDPNAAIAHFYLGRSYWETGNSAGGIACMEKAVGLSKSPLMEGHLAVAYLASGRATDSEAILASFNAGDRYVPAASRATVCLGRGETELALYWLERAVEERSCYCIWMRVDPIYAPLAGLPRFEALADRVGLPGGR